MWKSLLLVGLGFLAFTAKGRQIVSNTVVAVTSGVRGIRNNNPTNLRISSDAWQGQVTNPTDLSFVQFISPEYGFRAAARNLRSYFSNGFNTVSKIISRWAPASENNTASYINAVCMSLGVQPNDVLTLNESTMLALLKAITVHENGFNPYTDDVILSGMRMN